jgi:hypothetical protein
MYSPITGRFTGRRLAPSLATRPGMGRGCPGAVMNTALAPPVVVAALLGGRPRVRVVTRSVTLHVDDTGCHQLDVF